MLNDEKFPCHIFSYIIKFANIFSLNEQFYFNIFVYGGFAHYVCHQSHTNVDFTIFNKIPNLYNLSL